MPTPDRTSLAAIVTAGRELLERGGPAKVSMQAVADRVGVRAPSLYKRVRDREALLQLIAEDIVDDLGTVLAASDGTLTGLAHAYRTFAHTHPEGFRYLYASSPDLAHLQRTSEPVLQAARATVGEERALDAARLVTAWATGFLSMELAGAFRLGGDVDGAFEYGLAQLQVALRQS